MSRRCIPTVGDDDLGGPTLSPESVEYPGCYTLLRDPRSITARDISDAVLDDGAAPAELGLAAEFPMLGKITDESFQTLERQVLERFYPLAGSVLEKYYLVASVAGGHSNVASSVP